jgi:hypothetical protein
MKTIKPVLQVIALLILTVLSGSFLLILFFGSYSIDVGKFFRYYNQKQREVLLREGKPVITINLSTPSIRVGAANIYQESKEKVIRVYYEMILPMPTSLTSEWFPDRLGWWKGTVYAGKQTGYIFPAEEIEPDPVVISDGWRHDKTPSSPIMGWWDDENLQIKCSNYLTWKQKRPNNNDQLQKEE